MEQIRFEPLISTSRAADHRRNPAGQNPAQDMFADMLGEQLKKRASVEHADLPVRRRMSELRGNGGEPLTGRAKKPLILAHPKTLRGTAEEVEQSTQTRLSNASERAQAVVAENPASERAKFVVAGITAEDAEAPAEPPVDDKEQGTDPTAEAPTTIQVAEEIPAAPVEDADLIAPEIVVPAEGEAAPDTADLPTDGEPAVDGETAASAETAPAAIAIEAATDADLAAALAILDTGTAAAPATNTASQANVVAQSVAATAAATAASADAPVVSAESAAVEVTAAQPAVPAEPKPAKAHLETKPRPTPAAHTAPEAAKPGAQPATPATPAQPHLVSGIETGPRTDFNSGGNFGEDSFEGVSGQGWAQHLAQGAASKRPDFVAQLKQHLQNLPAHEQVAIHVQRALREGTNRFSIQLSPQELGRIQVKLEIDEEKRVTAAVSVERPSTLELLQRDVRGLERALQDAGLKMDGGNLSFSLSQSSDQEWAQELERQGLGGSGSDATDLASSGDDTAAPAPAVLDTAAGVADLRV